MAAEATLEAQNILLREFREAEAQNELAQKLFCDRIISTEGDLEKLETNKESKIQELQSAIERNDDTIDLIQQIHDLAYSIFVLKSKKRALKPPFNTLAMKLAMIEAAIKPHPFTSSEAELQLYPLQLELYYIMHGFIWHLRCVIFFLAWL